MEPASLTKIMTTLLALELGELEEEVTIPPEAMDRMWESTTAGLMVGERLPLEELLYAMMLPSGNDAANGAAIHLGGNLGTFVDWMNQRAEELGMRDTRFRNAHGLPDRGHYSTAYDLGLLTRAAMAHPDFARVSGAPEHRIPATNRARARRLRHISQMVVPGAASYYPGTVAAKTGWTRGAGNCLMTVAQRGDRTLLVIILRSDYAVVDTMKLLDYGFEQFQRATLRLPQAVTQTLTLADSTGAPRRLVVTEEPEELSFLLPRGMDSNILRLQLPSPQDLEGEGKRPLTLDLVARGGADPWPYPLSSLGLVLLDPPQPAASSLEQPRGPAGLLSSLWRWLWSQGNF